MKQILVSFLLSVLIAVAISAVILVFIKFPRGLLYIEAACVFVGMWVGVYYVIKELRQQ